MRLPNSESRCRCCAGCAGWFGPCCTATGTCSAAPHLGQNADPFGLGVPHCIQNANAGGATAALAGGGIGTAEPHREQNADPSGFCVPHWMQNTGDSLMLVQTVWGDCKKVSIRL